MFWPKDLLLDPERFLLERFGFGVLAHVRYKWPRLSRLVAVRDVRAQDLLPDPERFLKKRLGFGVFAFLAS